MERNLKISLFRLSVLLFGGALLSACLDIPSTPSTKEKATSLSVALEQGDTTSVLPLKINSQNKAIFRAHVHPSIFEDELQYRWYHDNELLYEGKSFEDHFVIEDLTPNRLVAEDAEGNQLETEIHFILNAPPRLGATIIPADSSLFYVASNEPIHFEWYVYEPDNDELNCTLILDGQGYATGSITQVSPSGFEPGWHSFYIQVEDIYGNKTTSKTRYFRVYSPEDSL